MALGGTYRYGYTEGENPDSIEGLTKRVEALEEGGGGGGTTDYNKLKIMGGTLGKGVIKLSQAQSDALLDQLGFDMYNYYLDRLANYIIETGAIVHNHYETILKWCKEDGSI